MPRTIQPTTIGIGAMNPSMLYSHARQKHPTCWTTRWFISASAPLTYIFYLASSHSFHYLDSIHDTTSDTQSNPQDRSQFVECMSSPQGDLCRYVGRSFWALASIEVKDGDVLLQTQQRRLLTVSGRPRPQLRGVGPHDAKYAFVESVRYATAIFPTRNRAPCLFRSQPYTARCLLGFWKMTYGLKSFANIAFQTLRCLQASQNCYAHDILQSPIRALDMLSHNLDLNIRKLAS